MYEISGLERQNEALKKEAEKLTYEKIAIDQMYCESLKSALTLRSSLLCYEAQNKELNEKVVTLENELKKAKEAYSRKDEDFLKEVTEL